MKALLIPFFVISILQWDWGLGRHADRLADKEYIFNSRTLYVEEILLILSTLFSRVSVCLFLLRIFTVNVTWRWTLFAIIALTTVTNGASAIILFLQCSPHQKLWNPSIPGTCWEPGVQVAIGQWQGGQI